MRKTCGVLSQCCQAAVEAGMISTNPFEDVPQSAGANAARECYVKADTVRRVMQAMPALPKAPNPPAYAPIVPGRSPSVPPTPGGAPWRPGGPPGMSIL